jgi:hypothetical protein
MQQDSHPRLVSAADVRSENYPRARFDEGVKFGIRELAKHRAPNNKSQFRHEIGVAGEFAVSGYWGVAVNKEFYDDFNGDAGWDLSIEKRGETIRIEVKSVHTGELELRATKSELETADYFILCQVSPSLDVVEIVGGIHADELAQVGEESPYDSTVRAKPRHLEILEPRIILPDDIREAQRSDSASSS